MKTYVLVRKVRKAVELAKDLFSTDDIMKIANIDDPTGELKQLVISNLLSRKDLESVYNRKTYYFKKIELTPCKNSTPHEKPAWKNHLVRCNSTGSSCRWGATHKGCPTGKTPQDMAKELR